MGWIVSCPQNKGYHFFRLCKAKWKWEMESYRNCYINDQWLPLYFFSVQPLISIWSPVFWTCIFLFDIINTGTNDYCLFKSNDIPSSTSNKWSRVSCHLIQVFRMTIKYYHQKVLLGIFIYLFLSLMIVIYWILNFGFIVSYYC